MGPMAEQNNLVLLRCDEQHNLLALLPR